MAVIPALPGIEVTIRVNRIPLPEYEDDEDIDEESDRTIPTYKVSKYIESTEGQQFDISFSVSNPYEMDCPSLGFTTVVDGKKISSRSMDKLEYLRNRGSWTGSKKGINKGQPGEAGVFRAFTFSAIKTSLDDDALAHVKEDTARVSKVGEISVSVFRKGQVVWGPRHNDPGRSDIVHVGEVHEKAMKGQAKYHGVKLGEAQSVRISNESGKSWRLDLHPMARFIFKYRSRDALKQLLIIPRTPDSGSPISRQMTPSIGHHGDRTSRRQVGQPPGGVKQEPKIKRERDDMNDSASFSKKRKSDGSKIMIDLTLDSDGDD